MEINRNQYFLAGMVLLLLGLQFRFVDHFVLNERAGQFVSERLQQTSATSGEGGSGDVQTTGSTGNKLFRTPRHFHPPEWLGWVLISLGSVLILHSLAMPRPG